MLIVWRAAKHPEMPEGAAKNNAAARRTQQAAQPANKTSDQIETTCSTTQPETQEHNVC
jgi:hypothetical protein